MDSIFKKLNILIKATISDLTKSPLSARRSMRGVGGGLKGLERQIQILRERMQDAYHYEDKLIQEIEQLGARVEEWDAKADAAVEANRDADARYAIARMQRYRQQLAIAEADLDDHRRVSQELQENINRLEAIVEEAKQQTSEEETPIEEDTSLVTRWSDFIRTTQNRLGDILSSRSDPSASDIPDDSAEDSNIAPTSNTDEIDDDLSRRRSRLSKPGT